MLVITEYIRELRTLILSLRVSARILVGVLSMALVFLLVRFVFWLTAGNTLFAVAGAVTYDGLPVPIGTIVFDPLGDGQRRESLIKDGQYALTSEAGLLRNAEYMVRVRAFRKTGRKYENAEPASSFDEYEQYLPDHYYANPQIRVIATRQALAKELNVAVTSGSAR